MSEPMIVLAISRGYYNEKIRYEGERFAISDKSHFSPRWMVDPDGPDMTSAYRAMAQAYDMIAAKPSGRTVTDEQLIAEVTQSSGVIAGLRAENLQLKERLSALEAKLDGNGRRKAAEVAIRDATPRAGQPGSGASDEDVARTGEGDDAGEEAGNVPSGHEAGSRRVRRTG